METTEKLKELLELCIEKKLSYSYYNCGAIQVTRSNENDEGWEFYEYVGIYDFWGEERVMENLNDLIEKVKNYNP